MQARSRLFGSCHVDWSMTPQACPVKGHQKGAAIVLDLFNSGEFGARLQFTRDGIHGPRTYSRGLGQQILRNGSIHFQRSPLGQLPLWTAIKLHKERPT